MRVKIRDIIGRILERCSIEGARDLERIKEIIDPTAEKTEQLASSQRHEVDDEAYSPDRRGANRRDLVKFVFCAAGGFAFSKLQDAATGFMGDQLALAANEVSNATFGKKTEISPETIEVLEQARRLGLGKLAVPGNFRTDERRLWEIMARFDNGAHLKLEELSFLREVSNSHHKPDVRAFASIQRSAAYSRRGLDQQATTAIDLNLEVDRLHPSRRLSFYVQRANVHSMVSPYHSESFDPIQSPCMSAVKEFEARCGGDIGRNIEGVYDLNDTQFANAITDYGPPLVHMAFFRRHLETYSRSLDRATRRSLWRQQREFYRRCLDKRIVGAANLTRAIWNHLPLMALQAHRFGDFDERDFYVSSAFGVEGGVFGNLPLNEALAERFKNRDPNYILFILFVCTLGLRDEKFLSFPRAKSDLEFFVKERFFLPNQPIRVALDAFRKREKGGITADEAVRDYLFMDKVYRGYVLEVPVN